jgi:hypothetical protein
MSGRYRQHLPDLDLSIERYTDAVPHDGAWYLLRGGERLGRVRSLKAARDAWNEIVEQSGWSPSNLPVDTDAALRREQKERWARNRAG